MNLPPWTNTEGERHSCLTDLTDPSVTAILVRAAGVFLTGLYVRQGEVSDDSQRQPLAVRHCSCGFAAIRMRTPRVSTHK